MAGSAGTSPSGSRAGSRRRSRATASCACSKEIRSFGGIDPATFRADLRFSLRHVGDFSRCAVVTEKRWLEGLAKAMDPLVACEIRRFPPERITAARDWLRAPATTAALQASR